MTRPLNHDHEFVALCAAQLAPTAPCGSPYLRLTPRTPEKARWDRHVALVGRTRGAVVPTFVDAKGPN